MGGFLSSGPVDEPVSTALLSYGIPFIAIVSALVNLVSLALYHRNLRDAVRILWNTYRILESKPEVLKAAVLILVAFFWHQVVLIGTLPVKTMVIYAMLIVTDLQICFIAFLVEGAFKALHLKIKEYYNLLTVSEEGQPPLYFDEPCLQQGRRAGLDLYELRQVHSQLFHVVTTANAAYNIPAFVVTVTCRFFTTLYLYRWIISKFISMQLFYALLTLQRIFYICYRFEALKRVEKATTDMVNGLDKSPLNTKTRAEFKLYLIQLKSYKMVFNSIHMFDLDFSLITSMFTTTITYLMLLQQFT